MINGFTIQNGKVIIRLKDRVCDSTEELLSSQLFAKVVASCIDELQKRNSTLLGVFGDKPPHAGDIDNLVKTIQFLAKMPGDLVPNVVEGADVFLKDKYLLSAFVEHLYNHWRSFSRFIICDSQGDRLDKRPYRTFNATIEQLMHVVRQAYRDIQENITNNHPRVYRQVAAGAEVAAIALPVAVPFRDELYKKLNAISVIRQVLLFPPLILDPPTNKRTGKFERIAENPLKRINVQSGEWLCYPARVGTLLIMIYFHEKFYELGFALSNLFELADDSDLERQPDAVYLYGVPGDVLQEYSSFPTVFYDDAENGTLVAAVPNGDAFGYFGYLKKMVLTLHNIIIMKQNKLPFHGALIEIQLRNSKKATVLFIGDTGAGKSESLEALRQIGEENIQDLTIIADDMGSLDIAEDGSVIGYGTEIGAFLRLDDLQPGYAFGQIDRAIILSAGRVNARIIMPVTTYNNVIRGTTVDFILYANNYEEIDEDHPIIEHFTDAEKALKVFSEGAVMSKGTTTSTGLVHSYFANVFGPVQYKQLHDQIAARYFKAFYDAGIFVGQIRTRLGIQGMEMKGPEEAAEKLLDVLRGFGSQG